MSQVTIFTVCNTLLTDLNPDQSATIQAGYNLIRRTLSAGGIASLQALIDATGVGCLFVFYAIIGALCIPIFMLVKRCGMRWRTTSLAVETGKILRGVGDRGTEVGKEKP